MNNINILSESMKYKSQGVLKARDNRLVLEVDSDITAYYRKLVGMRQVLLKPSFGSHITVLVNKDAQKYDGCKIDFYYSHLVRISGDTTNNDRPAVYYFLDVWSENLLEIRKEFKLNTWFKFHLTIGRLFY